MPSSFGPILRLHSEAKRAFTLIEVLVGVVILSLLMGLIIGIVRSTTGIWTRSLNTITAFQDARVAFEDINRTLSKATLNTYWTFVDGSGTEVDSSKPATPARFRPFSSLQFVIEPASKVFGNGNAYPGQAVFFQAPLGRADDANAFLQNKNLLNTLGYFVEFADDTDVPSFVKAKSRFRYRLMRLLQPTEELSIYNETLLGNDASKANWYKNPLANGGPRIHSLADNILALVLKPQLPEAEDSTGLALVNATGGYNYHSATPITLTVGGVSSEVVHQLPPIVEVTMVAVDENSMNRLTSGNSLPELGVDLGSLFQSPSAYEADLKQLCDALAEKNITYRVFTSKIPIQGAKWSVQ